MPKQHQHQHQHQEEVTLASACWACTQSCMKRTERGDEFHTPAFCRIYDTASRERLKIPSEFISDFKSMLSDNIVLEGPTGQIWPVSLEQNCLTQGWSNFVKDNCLKPGQLLFFSMVYSAYFEVKIFHPDGDEIQAQYRIIDI